jgi:ectoine hydroxylase-related dioxygenase (phytanoyl-CoA dioxygenase family)
MNRKPPRPVTDAEIEAYERDGVVMLPGMIDRDWIDALCQAIERDIANPGHGYHGYETEDGKGRFHGNFDVRMHDEVFRDYCEASPLPALAGSFLRSKKVNLFYDQLFVKEPGTNAPTPWHNDQPYWCVKGWQVMTFWLALDPVTLDSGAVEYVRGSHKWDRWFQPESFSKKSAFQYERNPDYEPMPDIEGDRADYDIVSFDMEPGDLLAFHAMILHGSGGNTRSDRRRRGFAVRYTGDDATYDPRTGTNPGVYNPDLQPGDPMDSRQYPLVWQSA